MARIRTIKPEFWTDEKIVQLPYEARLFFIGLWNFCDDDGYLMNEPNRLRMQILPNDNVDPTMIIDLLCCAGLLDLCETEDAPVLLVRHFKDHQKVSHSAPSKIKPKVSGKLAIPMESRRGLATKYGCEPGGEVFAECYCCKNKGRIKWWQNCKGEPTHWVSFSDLEISHMVAEADGGGGTIDNLVLCCRKCNRSMKTSTPVSRLIASLPEVVPQKAPEASRVLRPELNGIELNGKENTNSRVRENESENENIPKPSDFDPLKAQNEAKRLAKLYTERTKCPHSNAGCEGAIYALLNAQVASTSILEAAIAGYAEDPKRKNADSKYTLSGRKFFGEGGWEEYKDGKAPATIDDDPQNLRKATAKLLAEKAERRRQIELERPEVERQDAEFLKTYGVPRTFFNRGMAHAGKLKTLAEIAAEAEQKAQGGVA